MFVSVITAITVLSLTGSLAFPAFAGITETNLAENASIQTTDSEKTHNYFSVMESIYPEI